MSSVCSSPTGTCINFPTLGWTLFMPSNTMLGTTSIGVLIDNGVFLDRSNELQFQAESWVNGKLTQLFLGNEPAYTPLIPVLSTNMTQAEPEIQRIVRNFDNILELSMAGIWRTNLTKQIIVNTPASYAPLDDGYCMAGANMADISGPTYFQFACNKTGPQQITIVINDTWLPSYSAYTVVLFYRGFLGVNATFGQTSASTVTSLASLDPAVVWVIDENTAYSFFIDPVPTPIIRDINLNLKSFADRLASISDYCEFYSALWPYTWWDPNNTAIQITELLFDVDDAFSYPNVNTLVCYITVINKQQVTCSLRRQAGKTQILVEMPATYQNGPFLIYILNTAENLLFICPNREGSFDFNVTFLNGTGSIVEQSQSKIDISGAYLATFSAQPILIDPLVKTLYDIEFTTTGRVTPQGYSEAGQTVSTQIVLFFQTYDPAFPIDLGSGVANNSQISCVPVLGITGTFASSFNSLTHYISKADRNIDVYACLWYNGRLLKDHK